VKQNTQAVNHTPGPWQYIDGGILSEKINDYGNFVVASIQRERTPQDESNGRLIAAAPELLEAVAQLSHFLVTPEVADWLNRSGAFSTDYGKAIIAANAAIAKAEGRIA
jgi:hypothetical protein